MEDVNMTSQEAQDRLEEILDAIGVSETMVNLAAVCFAKADHLRSNWQDERTAKAWDALGRRVDTLSKVAL